MDEFSTVESCRECLTRRASEDLRIKTSFRAVNEGLGPARNKG